MRKKIEIKAKRRDKSKEHTINTRECLQKIPTPQKLQKLNNKCITNIWQEKERKADLLDQGTVSGESTCTVSLLQSWHVHLSVLQPCILFNFSNFLKENSISTSLCFSDPGRSFQWQRR